MERFDETGPVRFTRPVLFPGRGGLAEWRCMNRQAFDGVVGQEPAVAALQAQLAATGGSGSTLIVGPDGVGRFLLARRAADLILGPAVRSDLYVLDPEAGIDGVREATAQLARKPLEGPRSVLILRDLDRFSGAAHNALLKTLEEPPAGAAIFLVAQGVELLPETVVSRCRTVRARPLTDADCARVAGVEDARDAEGSPGRAVFQAQAGVGEAAQTLLALLERPAPDPLAEVDKLVRKKSGVETKEHRRRLIEVLAVVAARLRRRLPESEDVLREVVLSIGSLGANANPAIVFCDLALGPWKKKQHNPAT